MSHPLAQPQQPTLSSSTAEAAHDQAHSPAEAAPLPPAPAAQPPPATQDEEATAPAPHTFDVTAVAPRRTPTSASLIPIHDQGDDDDGEDEYKGGCTGALQRGSAKLDVWSASIEASTARRKAEASRRRAQRRSRRRWWDEEEVQGSDYQPGAQPQFQNVDAQANLTNGEPDPSKWAKPGYLKGDGIVKRKGMIPIVLAVLSWVYLVYVWRICYPALRQTSQALASRGTGIGLLVAFNIIWIITMWSYLRVITTGPGLVRDHAEECEPPMTPPETTPRIDTHDTSNDTAVSAEEKHRGDGPQMTANADGQDQGGRQDQDGSGGDEDDVDPALPAFLGPMAAAAWAASEGSKVDPTPSISQQAAPSASQSTTPAPSPLHISDAADQTADSGIGATSATRSMRPVDGISAPSAPARLSNSHRPSFHLLPEPTRRPEARHPLSPASRYCYRCRRMRPPRAHHCRRCGTCVLRMDHHCPWVGGCVGARNHKLFMHFLQWVTTLELFVLVSDAVLFSRGVKRVDGGVPWTVDGFMISLFPICAIFLLFTGALVGAHTYLFIFNLTTLEQMSVQRLRRGEDVALGQFFSKYGQGGEGWNLKGRKAVRDRWNEEWGSPRMEGNLFWIDRPIGQRSVQSRDKEKTAGRSGKGGDVVWRKGNFWTSMKANWQLVMGEHWWGWILPITKGPMDGLAYPLNPRHDAAGNWRPRREWPEELR